MSTWMKEELEIASRKPDNTLRKSTIIWVVGVGDDLCVRSVNGRTSNWFRGVQKRHEGRIWADDVEKDVHFEEISAEDAINNQINMAYSNKYRHYAASIIDRINSVNARSATIKLLPLPSYS